MREEKTAFDAKGATIVAVTPAPPAPMKQRFESQGYPFSGLSDVDGKAHKAYGLFKSSIWNLIAPRPVVIAAALRAAKGGHYISAPQGNVKRLQGSFVIGKDGKLRYAFRSKDATINPPNSELLAALG